MFELMEMERQPYEDPRIEKDRNNLSTVCSRNTGNYELNKVKSAQAKYNLILNTLEISKMRLIVSFVLLCNLTFAQSNLVMDCNFFIKAAEFVINDFEGKLHFPKEHNYILLDENIFCENEEFPNLTTKSYRNTITVDSLKLKVADNSCSVLELDEVKIYEYGLVLKFVLLYYYQKSADIETEFFFEVSLTRKTILFIPFSTNEFVILE